MKKIVSAILAASLMFANSVVFAKEYPQKFWDVPKDHWAFEYIADLADRGVINGYDDGSFKPTKTVSRAEWAKMMVVAAGVLVNDNSVNFTDMSNHWANKYVNAAKNYLTGYKDGSYRPDQAATREDVTVAMVKLKGYDISEVDYSNLSEFKDNDSISNYAKVYVSIALAKDLISGFEDNTFRGQATLTRAEAATLLYRAFQKGSNDKLTDVSSQIAENTNNINTEQIENSNMYEEIKDEPIEQTEKENYMVETLCDTNISLLKDPVYGYEPTIRSMITSDNVSKIYFVEDNTVCSVDIDGNKDILFEGSSLDYREGFDVKSAQIANICYDSYNNQLLIVTTQNNGLTGNLYILSADGTIENMGRSPRSMETYNDMVSIVTVLSNGKYVLCDYTYNAYEYLRIGKSVMESTIDNLHNDASEINVSAVEIGDFLYYVTNYGLYRYDFNKAPEFFELSSDACGLSENGAVFEKNGEFLISYIDGTETFIDNYAVKDKKVVNPAYKLFLMENGSIVFYDDVAKAFRILKKEA